MKHKKKKSNIFIVLTLVCLLAYLSFFIVQNQIKLNELKKDSEIKRHQLDALKRVNREMEKNIDDGLDDEYVESIARERLGFAYADEKIFIDTSGN